MMPVRGKKSSKRISWPAAFVAVALAGFVTAAAGADAFEEAFPAPLWQRAKSAKGYAADCVSKDCGRGSHAFYLLGPANPTIAENIRSGAINRDWAEKLAVSFRKSQGDKITVLDFTVQSGQVPGWLMVYECNCDGKTNYISSQVISAERGAMTFFSSARTQAASLDNMNRLVGVVLGPAGR